MSGPIQIISDKLLLVEGKDEENLCKKFFDFLDIPNSSYQIIDIGGKDQFRKKLPTLILVSNFSVVKKIGIIRDADDNAISAFDSIKDTLKRCNLLVPKKLNSIVHKKEEPSVIVYIQPNNTDSGAIENLCLDSIEDKQVTECIDEFFECFKKDNVEYKKLAKRKVQVYLSTLPNSKIFPSIGLAALAGYWDFSHAAFAQYEQFLKDFVA